MTASVYAFALLFASFLSLEGRVNVDEVTLKGSAYLNSRSWSGQRRAMASKKARLPFFLHRGVSGPADAVDDEPIVLFFSSNGPLTSTSQGQTYR
jgi:hypothetical protein